MHLEWKWISKCAEKNWSILLDFACHLVDIKENKSFTPPTVLRIKYNYSKQKIESPKFWRHTCIIKLTYILASFNLTFPNLVKFFQYCNFTKKSPREKK